MISSELATSIMISPALAQALSVPTRSLGSPLWDLAGSVPSLDLRFAENRSLVDSITGLNLITFSRTSEKTVRGPTAPIVVASGLPAFENDPVTGESLGLLIEEQRVQILELTDTLATQTKTVAATAHTLSFYGTGTVVLSGAHSATVAGLGAYPTRTTLTFTPSAGSLTLTVSGSVRFAQLEAGAFATSYIPNSGTSQVARAADVASISGSNFSSWYNSTQGSVFIEAQTVASNAGFITFRDNSAAEYIRLGREFNGLSGVVSKASGVTAALYSGQTLALGNRFKGAFSFAVDNFALSQDGSLPVTDTSGLLPDAANELTIGLGRYLAPYINGHIRRLTYWPQRLPNATLPAITQ